MEIVEICAPFLYSIRYNSGQVEYYKLFTQWENVEWLLSFFEQHSSQMDPTFWGKTVEPEIASSKTLQEAFDLEEQIETLLDNTKKNEKPNLDTFFKPLEGEYVYVWDYTPVKAYGPQSPSLLRLYAIKLTNNCYIITGGGVKYCRTMQESPELKGELKKINRVRSFLIKNSIITNEDI